METQAGLNAEVAEAQRDAQRKQRKQRKKKHKEVEKSLEPRIKASVRKQVWDRFIGLDRTEANDECQSSYGCRNQCKKEGIV